jgi:signal transduction histidine kinase/ligand-binding sensor domain-containing protein
MKSASKRWHGERCLRRSRSKPALALITCAALGAFLWSPALVALNPSLDITQYGHTAWSYREGFQTGAVYAIAQTADGYLWLGTQSGVFRFDGVRTVPLPLPAGHRLANTQVGSLLVARDGTLWIGTLDGLMSWNKSGQLTEYPSIGRRRINALLQDRQGTVWAGTALGGPAGRLCAIRADNTDCYGDDGSLGGSVQSLYEDSEGALWVGAYSGVWRWKPGSPTRYLETTLLSRGTLAQGAHGSGLIVGTNSFRQIVGGRVMDYPVPGLPLSFYAAGLLRDHNGGLWIGTVAQGLLHSYGGKTSRFTHNDGLSSDQVKVLFEDREGSIWVGTVEGLHRFRELPVTSFSEEQGLSSGIAKSVLTAHDGSIWIGTQDGLDRWKDGHTTIYRPRDYPALPEDGITTLYEDQRGRIWAAGYNRLAVFENEKLTAVPSVPKGANFVMTGDNHGGLWLGLWFSPGHDGLTHLVDGKVTEEVPAQKLGGGPILGIDPDPDGGVWVGLSSGGLVYVREGQIRKMPLSEHGNDSPRVMSLARDRHGALWAATEDGLSRINNGPVATLSTANGLPCNEVHWIIEDDLSSHWLYTGCGLLRIPDTEFDAWVADPRRKVQATIFGSADGVRLVSLLDGFGPAVTKSPDGKIWFLNATRLSVIDPSRIAINTVPPPVHIEQLSADRKTYDARSGLRLPPLVRDLWIDYTALSLVVPEKVHFKYRLEGQDPEWKEVVNDREAQYSNLAPGNYRFRVLASNNSGLWNEQGASLEFSIEPAYWQTNWFRALCVIVFAATVLLIYRRRLRQVAWEFELGLEARVGERTRIARELHDTLLQSFQAVLLRFQTVANRLQRGPEKQILEDAIQEGSAAIAGGRDAIQDLRATTVVVGDLEMAINGLGQELAASASEGRAPAFEVDVQGTPRSLRPIVRDEIYRIVAEALRNAFRHSEAQRIEVEVRYEDPRFVVSVRDDGKGIDPEVMQRGRRSGHFGLLGIRERSGMLGGDLEVWTDRNSGTEVELSFPASVAYASSRSKHRFAMFGWLPWKRAVAKE